MNHLIKFWPVILAAVALIAAGAETRLTVADHEDRLDRMEQSEKVELIQQKQAVIFERTKTIKEEQTHQRHLLEQILREVQK